LRCMNPRVRDLKGRFDKIHFWRVALSFVGQRKCRLLLPSSVSPRIFSSWPVSGE
jgi:hypothetical protein